ncbi:tryptophan 7-halogenase [Asticcacaulis tiandongensis]|uniref:tryptophan 7-halogenase n=1 Tax=Asticcacaulis tiandongensis TaxID=2565365 RepID=UPI00112B536F|nr:tryptophan 7-halogenase [Asticcacaulis tiandongensis]
MMTGNRISRVVIVGSDESVWLSALALHRGFARSGVSIEVIELPTLLQSSDVCATLPNIRNFHRLMGLDQAELIRHCGASFTVGQRFVGFAEKPFLHVYSSAGASMKGLPFVQAWLKARTEGLEVPYEEFAVGAGLAKSGRFAPPRDALEAETCDYAYHIHAASYAGWLKAHALHRGVTVSSVPDITPQVGNGRIEAIILPDGQRIEADLFVDATGAQGKLIAALEGDDFEDWSEWLPLNRLLVTAGKGLSPLPLYAQITAHAHGWAGLYPHQGQTGMVMAYDGAALSDDEALKALVALTGVQPTAGATVNAFTAGQRRKPWIGNCVAIGESACVLDPLDASRLHVTQIGLTHLMSLFPIEREVMPEQKLFNDDVRSHYERLRNVSVVHYKLNQRQGEGLWDRARDTEVPPELAYKLKLYADRGLLMHMDHESFTEDSWHMLLLGQGLIPRTYDYKAENMFSDKREAVHRFQSLLGGIKAQVMTLPSHEQALARAAGLSGADRGRNATDWLSSAAATSAPSEVRRDGWLRPDQAEVWARRG